MARAIRWFCLLMVGALLAVAAMQLLTPVQGETCRLGRIDDVVATDGPYIWEGVELLPYGEGLNDGVWRYWYLFSRPDGWKIVTVHGGSVEKKWRDILCDVAAGMGEDGAGVLPAALGPTWPVAAIRPNSCVHGRFFEKIEVVNGAPRRWRGLSMVKPPLAERSPQRVEWSLFAAGDSWTLIRFEPQEFPTVTCEIASGRTSRGLMPAQQGDKSFNELMPPRAPSAPPE